MKKGKTKTTTFSTEKKAMAFYERLTKLGYGCMACGASDIPWIVTFFRVEK